ncbi:MAG: Sodium:proton exchanger [Patescibacteria group bacterium]|jgi:cation:H+ antiporter|nr:Sodium:proton exchanger [Patescibacteria group bacterium]MDQ5971022.1 Sodium:proton exchanger [Patescibacteria group bacterium]
MLTYFLFVVGFVLLIKGADWLVDGASSIARKLKISNIVIGLTIVAFGTSAPELIVNIMASIRGNSDIAIGNVVGSNIANILLILGISAIIFPLAVKKGTVYKEIPLSLLAVLALWFMANDILLDGASRNVLSMIDGAIFLLFFIIFLYYTFGISKATGQEEKVKELKVATSVFMVLVGIVALTVGGNWIVEGAILIAKQLGISEALIGLTIVAIGTSLPELATSAMAAYKKNPDIAMGNVVGSNIFNIFWILGVSALIHPINFSAIMNFDIYFLVFTTALLFTVMFIGKKHILERWQGVLFILIYVAYIVYLIARG